MLFPHLIFKVDNLRLGSSPFHNPWNILRVLWLRRKASIHPSDNQPFDFTNLRSTKCAVCMVVSCACLGPRHSPFSNYLCRTPDKAAVGTIFNALSFDAVSARVWTCRLPDNEQLRYVFSFFFSSFFYLLNFRAIIFKSFTIEHNRICRYLNYCCANKKNMLI